MYRCFFLLILSLYSFSCGEVFAERPFFTPSSRRVIIMLEGAPVSAIALDEHGRSLYKGLARKPQPPMRLAEYRAALDRQQDTVVRRLQALSPRVRVGRRFTGLINGMATEIPADLEGLVSSWPEVVAVVPTRKYYPSLNVSNSLMDVPEAWAHLGGGSQAGEGVRIGIIDSGIDHTHVMFDDSGYEYPEGFPLGEIEFTSKKIIVARAFPSVYDSAQDVTPRDEDGHGTHSAACAAGRLNTPSPLGPLSGVAPNAYLGNYRVFTGEFAETDQLIAALEACVEDGMDVVNMSLGSNEYVETPLDPEGIAIRNTVLSGVVVVAAAGNEGTDESIGSPGQFSEVITVGAVTNGHTGYDASPRNEATVNVYADGEEILTGVDVILADDPDYLSRPIVGQFPILDADLLDGGTYGGDEDGLICEDLPAGSAQGKWVLAQRGICTFSSKINRIEAAGGWGALIFNSSEPPEPDDEDFDPDLPVRLPSVPGTKIPAYFIGRSAGLTIKQAIKEHNEVEVEFVPPRPTENSQTPFRMSPFSSLGPTVDYTVKPELVAVGEGSYAAVQNDVPLGGPSGNRFRIAGFDFVSGTSFASPRVAGAAALVKQAHPSWDPARIKSALVQAAERPSPLDQLPTMTRGGGHVNVGKAVSVPVLAQPATLSFCRQMISQQTVAQERFTLENVSEATQSVTLQVDIRAGDVLNGSSVEPQQATLEPGEETEAVLTLVLGPPGFLSRQADMDGDVVISVNGSDITLRIPFWARVVHAPQLNGTVLLVDDDDNRGSEIWYEAAVKAAGYEFTRWDMFDMGQYPSMEYMSNFRTVVWFMATKSLNEVYNTLGEEEARKELNDRIRFNSELTRYLARGGTLLISGQDWSDRQMGTPFGQYVLHVRRFNHDPYADYNQPDEMQIESVSVVGYSTNPVGQGIGPAELVFDDDFANYTDTLSVDSSGFAKPAFRSSTSPRGVIGITVESCNYRAVFLTFALERLSEEAMNQIVSNALSWLGENDPKGLSILSMDPATQPDRSVPLTAVLEVTGVNFPVGNHVSLDGINLPLTWFKGCGQLEVVVPAGLPTGLYDVTVRTPDGQVATVPDMFLIGKGETPTRVDDWLLR